MHIWPQLAPSYIAGPGHAAMCQNFGNTAGAKKGTKTFQSMDVVLGLKKTFVSLACENVTIAM